MEWVVQGGNEGARTVVFVHTSNNLLTLQDVASSPHTALLQEAGWKEAVHCTTAGTCDGIVGIRIHTS